MNTENEQPKIGFWKRQFSQEVTTRQIVFDLLLGIILPLLFVLVDPIVFHYNPVLISPLVEYRIFSFVGMGLGMITLVCWIFFDQRLKIGDKWQGFFTGIMLFGALFAFALGTILLPFSLLGIIIYGLGLLGFTPFLTAFTYLRNAIRALKHIGKLSLAGDKVFFIVSTVLGFALIFAIPAFAQWETSRIVSQNVSLILSAEPSQVEQGVQGLKRAFWCEESCYKDIIFSYQFETDSAHREILAKAYQELTGQDIEVAVQEYMFSD